MTDYIYRTLIALDQLLNTILGGMPDETISARCYRLRSNAFYKTLGDLIDLIAWRAFGQQSHCLSAYYAELERSQLPRYFDV